MKVKLSLLLADTKILTMHSVTHLDDVTHKRRPATVETMKVKLSLLLADTKMDGATDRVAFGTTAGGGGIDPDTPIKFGIGFKRTVRCPPPPGPIVVANGDAEGCGRSCS
jgi:hypothetical protein